MSVTWFLLLAAAATAGMLGSKKTVKLYFKAQLLYTFVVFAAVRIFGVDDRTYSLVYISVTLPIIECCCILIWEARLDLRLYLTAINFGLFVGIIASIGLGVHPFEDYVTFCEGVFLAIIGMSLLLSVATSKDALAVRTIGTLSLALSCYDFAYLRNDSWAELNTWLPAALCTVAFWRIALATPRRCA